MPEDEDREAGIAELTRYLDSLPLPGPGRVRRYALHSLHSRVIATEWWDKGLRLHHDKAVVFPIPGQQRGAETGSKLFDWVDKDTYAQYMAEHPGAAAALAEKQSTPKERLQAALAVLNPELAEKLPSMTPEEREKASAEYAAKLPHATKRFADLAERNHRITQHLQDGTGGAQ